MCNVHVKVSANPITTKAVILDSSLSYDTKMEQHESGVKKATEEIDVRK